MNLRRNIWVVVGLICFLSLEALNLCQQPLKSLFEDMVVTLVGFTIVSTILIKSNVIVYNMKGWERFGLYFSYLTHLYLFAIHHIFHRM